MQSRVYIRLALVCGVDIVLVAGSFVATSQLVTYVMTNQRHFDGPLVVGVLPFLGPGASATYGHNAGIGTALALLPLPSVIAYGLTAKKLHMVVALLLWVVIGAVITLMR